MLPDDELRKQWEGLNKRLDTLTAEVVELKSEFRSHGELLRAMQQTQQELVKVVLQLNHRVDRLESGQERLIVLVGRIVDRLTDFEAGGTVELENVDYDKDARTLKGTIRRIAR